MLALKLRHLEKYGREPDTNTLINTALTYSEHTCKSHLKEIHSASFEELLLEKKDEIMETIKKGPSEPNKVLNFWYETPQYQMKLISDLKKSQFSINDSTNELFNSNWLFGWQTGCNEMKPILTEVAKRVIDSSARVVFHQKEKIHQSLGDPYTFEVWLVWYPSLS